MCALNFTFHQDLKAILVKSNIFEKLDEQAKLGSLPKRSRRQLISTFVEHTVQKLIWIPQKEFSDVFKKIQVLFKNEKIEKYYNEKTKGQGDAYPGGPLFSHYKHMHSFVKKEQGIRRNRKMKKP